MKWVNRLVQRISLILAALAFSFVASAEVPDGWQISGSAPGDYEVALADGKKGGSAASLKSVVNETDGFGTLMQTISATNYHGKRLRLTAAIEASNVEGWAGLWMRIDGQNGEILGFDNMQERPITGSIDWNMYQVVLDVPDRSEAIAFGVLLVGSGMVLIDDVRFDEVGKDVAITSESRKDLPNKPANLSFDD